MRKLLLFLLLAAPAFAQTYYTDCEGVAGTAQSGMVTCPNLPAGVTTATNYQAVVAHSIANQGFETVGGCNPVLHCFLVTAGSASSLQSQINAAAATCTTGGAWVIVPSGNTYTTTGSFNLPATNCDATHWVIIQSDNISLLSPQGTRISASTANMPTLSTSNPGSNPVINIIDNPGVWQIQGYWLAGLDIEDDPSAVRQFALVVLGDGCAAQSSGCAASQRLPSTTTASQLTSRIVVDRCWIHPTQATSNVHFAIRYTAGNFAVEDSILESHDTGASPGQPQALSSDFTFGPLDFGNSEILAPTENIIFGGSGGNPTGQVPSDIYIHGNYIHKRPEWIDHNGANYFQPLMRNFIECKNCQRMLVEGNIFDTDAGNSVSAALQFTPRDSNGVGSPTPCPQCTNNDIVVRYNKFSNISDFVSILSANCGEMGGSCTGGPTQPAKRISVHDNVVENLDRTTYTGNGRWIQLAPSTATSVDCSNTPNTNACQLSDIIISHNTFAGGSASSQTSTFVTLAGHPATTDYGYNIVVSNNIAPAGGGGFGGDQGTVHPLTGFFGSYFSSYTFDANAIAGVTSAGYGNSDFPSPICNFSTSSGCNAKGLPSSMSGPSIGFANYHGGIGGDYHLCFASAVPSGCTAESPYMSYALDGLLDSTKYSRSPGADVDAVSQMTACSLTGSCTIQPIRETGPYVGDFSENFRWLQMPGYTAMRTGDGGGVNNSTGHGNLTHAFFLANLGYRWWDLSHDPHQQYEVFGWDSGLMNYQYGTCQSNNGCLPANQGTNPCGFTGTDNKLFFDTLSLLYANNVRVAYFVTAPMNNGTDSDPPPVLPLGSLTTKNQWVVYRPGKVAERISIDSTCTSPFAMVYQPSLNTAWESFPKFPPATDSTLMPHYPPTYAAAWDRNHYSSVNPCNTGGSGPYNVCSPSPWRYVNMTGGTSGMIMNSATPGEGCPATQANCGSGSTGSMADGYTPGQTQDYGGGTIYPISAEFEMISTAFGTTDFSAESGNYRCFGAVGCRSQMQSVNVPVAANQTDAFVTRLCGWFGAFGIGTTANANLFKAECQTPPTPTMNSGTSPTYSPDRMDWTMTADVTTKVDFNTTGAMHSPTFCVTGWNGLAPIVAVNGATQALNVNYVYSTNDGSGDPCSNSSSGLLVQLVGLPSNGSGGVVTLPTNTHIVIAANAIPTGGGAHHDGTRHQTGKAIGADER